MNTERFEGACRGGEPSPGLAPSCGSCWFGGEEPGEVGPDWVVAQVSLGQLGEGAGLVGVAGASGKDGVGEAQEPAVDAVDRQAGTRCAVYRVARVGVADRCQQQRPEAAVVGRPRRWQAVEEGDAPPQDVHGSVDIVVEQGQ